MKYKPNWEKISKKFSAFWKCENETALMAVPCLKDGAKREQVKMPKNEDELLLWYTDPEIIYSRVALRLENSYLGGEALPVVSTGFGTAGHAKYFANCNYKITNDTIWYFPSLNDKKCLNYLGEKSILSTELSCIGELCRLGQGAFLVAMPDNCGTMDALAHLRGSENLLEDMILEPDWIKDCIAQIMEGYFHSSKMIFNTIRENNYGGSSHSWMHLWANGSMQQLQEDFSVMVSAEMFEEFILPELDKACKALDYSVYHFDGQEQIRHLDMLLEIKDLNAIQWTPVAGQPPTSHFIPTLKRIQASGKGLILIPDKAEVQELLDKLNPNGLYIIVGNASCEEEAKSILRMRATNE